MRACLPELETAFLHERDWRIGNGESMIFDPSREIRQMRR
jgi:hypothetical protein